MESVDRPTLPAGLLRWHNRHPLGMLIELCSFMSMQGVQCLQKNCLAPSNVTVKDFADGIASPTGRSRPERGR